MSRPADKPARRRVPVSLSPGEHEALAALAAERREGLATTAGRLLRDALTGAGATLDPPPKRRGARTPPQATEPPGALWLPTQQRAAAILTLRDRYPHDLRAVGDDYQRDQLIAESLAALSVWRDELDAGLHRDPRLEIAFGETLMRFGRQAEERRRRAR
jgi:hypothetical protein